MTTPMRRKMRGARYSRTVWLGLAVVITGFLEAQFRLVEHLIPDQWRGVAMMGVGLTVVVLRFLTTLPVEDLHPVESNDQEPPTP
jgi:hypothetical protein